MTGPDRGDPERGRPGPADSGERTMPPVLAADERTMLEAMLDWYREGVVRKVDGMRQADATTSPLGSGTTAAGLVKHLAYVEDAWATQRLAGRPAPEPWAGAPFDDDPDWEFSSAALEPLADSVALYERPARGPGRSRPLVGSTTPRCSGRTGRSRRAGCWCTCSRRPRATWGTSTSCGSWRTAAPGSRCGSRPSGQADAMTTVQPPDREPGQDLEDVVGEDAVGEDAVDEGSPADGRDAEATDPA